MIRIIIRELKQWQLKMGKYCVSLHFIVFDLIAFFLVKSVSIEYVRIFLNVY